MDPVRNACRAAACERVAIGCADEVSAVLANRLHTSERTIDMVLVLQGIRHERVAAALRTGVLSALEEARQAGASIEADIEDAA